MRSVRFGSLIRIVLLMLGIVVLVLGLFRGEATEIFHKAIIVCMECIGIG